MLFQRVSDVSLWRAGFNPTWIKQSESEGPYASYRFFNGTCPCCEGKASGWTVVNLETAKGHSTEWFHAEAEAETEADELASLLNSAWINGRTSRSTSKDISCS